MSKKNKKDSIYQKLKEELYQISPEAQLIAENPHKEPTEYFDLGNYALNAQVSGDIFKGAPAGKVTLFSGEESTGKTFLALNASRGAQRKGYKIIWVDTESAMDENLMERFQIDSKECVILPMNTIDNVIKLITKIGEDLKYLKGQGEDIPKMMIVIDSLGNLTTQREIDQVIGGNIKADVGWKQKLMKRLFTLCTVNMGVLQIPIIAVNHVYQTMNPYGEPTRMAGGAGPFYNSSTIIDLSKAKLKDGKDKKQQTGIIVTSKIKKSRFTKAGIPIKFQISHYKGMNPYIGLENFCDYKTCGIEKGKIKNKEFVNEGNKWYVEHLNKNLFERELYNSTIFTKDVLKKLQPKMIDIFELPPITTDYDIQEYTNEAELSSGLEDLEDEK